MADRAISELTAVTTVNSNDSFVLEQNNRAMRLTGQVLLNWLLPYADAHGGIRDITKTGTVGNTDTYTIEYADQTTSTFTVKNGKEITDVIKTGTNLLVDTYTITFNDGTTETFEVTNGRSITGIQKTGTDTLTDTYTISYNDATTSTFQVTNGKSITGFSKSSSGLRDTYVVSYNDGDSYTFYVDNGRGIVSVTKQSVGLRDTYTILYNDGDTYDFDVDNGVSITDISLTGSSGLVDTYTITYNNGTTSTFTVTNGEKGDQGQKGDQGEKGDNLTITTTEVGYAVNSSSITPPSTWSPTIPSTPQGSFLWTRVIINYSDNNNLIYYTVSRNGRDGTGSVISVNNVSPDENGNVDLVNVVNNVLVIGAI